MKRYHPNTAFSLRGIEVGDTIHFKTNLGLDTQIHAARVWKIEHDRVAVKSKTHNIISRPIYGDLNLLVVGYTKSWSNYIKGLFKK